LICFKRVQFFFRAFTLELDNYLTLFSTIYYFNTMKLYFLVLFFSFSLPYTIIAQNDRFALQVNGGVNIAIDYDGNTKDYTHLSIEDPYAYQVIGSYWSIEGVYQLKPKHQLTFGYSYRENRQKVKKGIYNSSVGTGGVLVDEDFKLDMSSNLFEVGYGYNLLRSKNNRFTLRSSIYYERQRDQQIIYNSANTVYLLERNAKTHGLEEFGVSGGFLYEHRLYDHVYLNLQSKFYYLVTPNYASHISITPGVSIYF